MTETETFNQRVERVADQSSGSFSYDRYRNWTACARMLLRRGWSDQQTEAILRSKWTRWAADQSRNPTYGYATSADLSRWIDGLTAGRGSEYVAEQVAELVAGTFPF